MSTEDKPSRAASFMRRKAVCFELGVTRNTLRKIENDGRFPRFFEISPGIEVIDRHDFEKWVRLRKLLARK